MAEVSMDFTATEWKANDTLLRITVSVRYHQRRARWFESWDLWIKGISVMAGTAAIGALWKNDPTVAAWMTSAITALTTLSLVFGYSTKARQHADFARRYCELESDLVSKVE